LTVCGKYDVLFTVPTAKTERTLSRAERLERIEVKEALSFFGGAGDSFGVDII
jgi:hypothetical protein